MWRQFRRKWEILPTHIRSGLLRLYVVTSIIWIIYVSYKISFVYRWRNSGWMLFLVPAGTPLGFFIVSWVLDGFRTPQSRVPTARSILRDRTAPWHNVAPIVIDAIFEALDGTELFDCFVFASMDNNLIPNYEEFDDDERISVIRAKISNLLCLHGLQHITALENEISKGHMELAKKIGFSAINLFEPAIAMSADQIRGYTGMATIYNLLGADAKSQEYAKRGLSELERIRESDEGRALRDSAVFPPGMFDREELLLRGYLG